MEETFDASLTVTVSLRKLSVTYRLRHEGNQDKYKNREGTLK